MIVNLPGLTSVSAGSETALGALDAAPEEADVSFFSGAAADPQATANSEASINAVNENAQDFLNHWFTMIEPPVVFLITLVAIVLVSQHIFSALCFDQGKGHLPVQRGVMRHVEMDLSFPRQGFFSLGVATAKEVVCSSNGVGEWL